MSDVEAVADGEAFESANELRVVHGQLLDALDRQLDEGDAAGSEAEAVARLEPQIRRFIQRGAATGVYLTEVSDRTSVQVLMDYWVSSLARAAIGAPSGKLAAFDASKAPDLKDKPCPYVGLDAFRGPAFFFGRDSDTQVLLAQLDRSHLVVVVGASGSGKSSLVMGGVLPALESGKGSAAFRIAPPIVPGNAVLAPLARTALQVSGRNLDETHAMAERLRLEPQYLVELLGGVDAPATVITIDQFEEVFTLVGQPEREALAAALAALLDAPAGHRVILTMREEFKSRLVELRALTGRLENGWYSMRPMGYEELRAAVEGPAAAVNLQFQPGIADDVVKKVLGQPAALPLLQFTLRALWDRRDRNRVTWDVYRGVGDPLTALQLAADRFYDSRSPETQREVRRILLELVRVDELLEAYRQPLPKSELLKAGQANTEAVLRLLEEGDYLRVTAEPGSADAIVEVKHESLIRNWPRFVAWIAEKRIERRQRLALSQAARTWDAAGRPTEGLLTGWQLEDAKRHSDLTDLETQFVVMSAAQVDLAAREREAALNREKEQAQALAKRERHLRRTQSIALMAVVLALVILWTQSRTLARLEKLYFAAAASEDPLTQALLLAELGSSSDREGLSQYAQFLQDVATKAIPTAVLNGNPDDAVVGVHFGSAGRVATVGASGVFRWWPADGRGAPPKALPLIPEAEAEAQGKGGTRAGAEADDERHRIAHIAFSADRHWMAVVSSSGAIRVGPVGSTDTPPALAEVSWPADSPSVPQAMALNATGDQLAVARDGVIQTWTRRSDGEFTFDRTLPGAVPINGLAFDPSGGHLAAASVDGSIRVWVPGSGGEPDVFSPDPLNAGQIPVANSVQFSADGKWLVGAYEDKLARIWSRLPGPPTLLHGHAGPVTAAAFGPAAGTNTVTVATVSTDQTVRLWTLRMNHELNEAKPFGSPLILIGHAASVRAVAFAADGGQLATGSADGTTRIWSTAPQEPRLLGRHDDAVLTVDISATGTRAVTASWDGTARVWAIDVPADPTRKPTVLSDAMDERPAGLRAAVFNPRDANQIATGSQDGRLGLWDVASGKPTFFTAAPAGGANALLAVAYSHDATRIAASSRGHEARLWHLAGSTLGLERSLAHPAATGSGENWVFDVGFHPSDSAQVITAAGDGRARLWIEGQPAGQCGEIAVHVHARASGSEDSRVLRAIVGSRGVITATVTSVRAWERPGSPTPCWHQPWEIRHALGINDVAVGPDNRILTASEDGTARVSDDRTGNPVLTLRNGSAVSAVTFDREGRHVVTGDSEGAVRLWRVAPDALAKHLAEVSTACLSPADRQRFLSQNVSTAQADYQACERRFGRIVP